MTSSFFDTPILNSPYEPPSRHHAPTPMGNRRTCHRWQADGGPS